MILRKRKKIVIDIDSDDDDNDNDYEDDDNSAVVPLSSMRLIPAFSLCEEPPSRLRRRQHLLCGHRG